MAMACTTEDGLNSCGLEVRRSDDQKGRGLFTVKGIREGAVIYREEPIVSCQFPWNQDAGYKACDHCMKPLETATENVRHLCQDDTIVLPFPEAGPPPQPHLCACGAVYCSQRCMEVAASRYHAALCYPVGTPQAEAIDKLRKCWKSVHYPPEEATIILILRIYGYIHQKSDAEKLAAVQEFTSMKADTSSPEFVEKLLGKFKDQLQDLWQKFSDCIKYLDLVVPEDLKAYSGFLTILSAVAFNSQGVGTCALSGWEQSIVSASDEQTQAVLEEFMMAVNFKIEDVVGLDFMNNEGAGLYEVQSKVNHSCEPNAEVKFLDNDHVLVLSAACDIQPGAEITISYIDQCEMNRSRHSRQKIIRMKYLFNCLCSKCERESDQPDETSEEEDSDADSSGDEPM